MKIIVLQDELYGYLQHVVRGYAAKGIDPEEGQALYFLSAAVQAAQNIEDSQFAKIKTAETNTGTPIAHVSVGEATE